MGLMWWPFLIKNILFTLDLPRPWHVNSRIGPHPRTFSANKAWHSYSSPSIHHHKRKRPVDFIQNINIGNPIAHPWGKGHLSSESWNLISVLAVSWHHNMKRLSILLVLCEGNHEWWLDSSHTGPTMSFHVLFVVSLNKLLNKQQSCRWSETPWHSRDVTVKSVACYIVSYLTSYHSAGAILMPRKQEP